ncbi:NAD(P)/FAD-dependent oxidoreductase [Vibrio parahaemolyticus]|uniref:NAD(P)/FAD-dependent oxidoreductase n=1 Tax=Vibrio parahaemolyticus TaxID=670 RepID=UPI0006A6D0C2|nr:NAD(P)/FAD-dependent oxidoreductase [Vibrio parahaemolyticus]EGR0212692.1 NAD(P)/FAD-dependent oxidoreductase [Vibrio parahaemolyticus]EIA1586830.1 NAD(P)/FAD-dependent oxidoreductase [Vibrio parahaemolyticus]EJG2024759.1 NAD(P)/FAD-dependent oxidoreductase [Vibrio parahaemolyticus]EJG2034516.1 NAD(P)/FAD-dependent oxidoreductase [Vibrio parahaemolyticus]ELB2777322.1 NAD(P)/FAD-dependent oxidoreductase [Vibrio parahaemolyticus]
MIRINEIKLPLDHEEGALLDAITKKLGIPAEKVISFNVFRRGYDARKKTNIHLIYTLDIIVEGDETALLAKFANDPHVRQTPDMEYKFVAKAPENLTERPIVIGFGPCGLFAGLVLAQMGFNPIIVERGKEVRERTKDTFGFWRKRTLNPESNVQFGEGGAGTFSDGKLYSQVKDPNFYGRKVITEFVEAGAPEEILYVSKPHIGTFKLVTMIEKMRATIIELGGEIRFSTRVDDLHMEDGQITGVILSNGEEIKSRHVVLAVGHSARDTFEMLHERGVYMEAKPFSVGFRIEHKQSMIDEARFGPNAGHPILGAADYKLVHHCKNGRTVYSFCMCPGGTVVAATSEEGRVVTNGMSQYSRAERNANSAIVVGISPEVDYPGDPLAGIRFQRELESNAYKLGGENYDAPAQKIGDFLKGRDPSQLGDVEPSFTPGIKLTDLSKALPPFAVEAIREAIPAFDRKIKGFASEDGLLTGVETRTSSPVCIKRGKDFQSVNLKGFYPAGEGAGYAGGILSAGIDGIKVAEAVARDIVAAMENA